MDTLFKNFVNRDVLISLVDTDDHIEGKVLATDPTGFLMQEVGTGKFNGKNITCYYPWVGVRYVQLASGTLENIKAA